MKLEHGLKMFLASACPLGIYFRMYSRTALSCAGRFIHRQIIFFQYWSDALSRLANLALPPPGLKFKKSAMPFIQMENISHFLRACESPPLNMPAHDRFLTVDLYESKDPAQVLQCLSAFSRVANSVNPANFPATIGPKRAGALSPASTGAPARNGGAIARGYTSSTPFKASAGLPPPKPMSPALTGGSTGSSNANFGLKSQTGTVSSWSKKSDEGSSSPAWNIHQYGYMGGASQGNQGVAFGARRQITSAAPQVPSLAEKERKRKEKAAEEDRMRVQAEEAEYKRKAEREAEEERERIEEEQKWEEQSRRTRDEERKRIEEQKRQWEEQERRWQIEEEARLKEEAETQRLARPAGAPRSGSEARLQGQFLSQYQSEQGSSPRSPKPNEDTPERRRVRELEKQLEDAKERERQYQLEREQRLRQENRRSQPEVPASPDEEMPRPPSPKESEASWVPDEREYLQRQWNNQQQTPAAARQAGVGSTRPLPTPGASAPKESFQPSNQRSTAPSLPSRAPQEKVAPPVVPTSPRPLPDPAGYQPIQQTQNRTDRFLATNQAPRAAKAATHQPAEMGFSSTYEEQSDKDRRVASQQKTKAGGWASKSLLEREMERERERQKEWEANQQSTKEASRDTKEGTGEGQSWDVNQYGWTGGDSQNKGSSAGSGIGFGGRRQIIGPRPLP